VSLASLRAWVDRGLEDTPAPKQKETSHSIGSLTHGHSPDSDVIDVDMVGSAREHNSNQKPGHIEAEMDEDFNAPVQQKQNNNSIITKDTTRTVHENATLTLTKDTKPEHDDPLICKFRNGSLRCEHGNLDFKAASEMRYISTVSIICTLQFYVLNTFACFYSMHIIRYRIMEQS
jgi:hypothetical protein